MNLSVIDLQSLGFPAAFPLIAPTVEDSGRSMNATGSHGWCQLMAISWRMSGLMSLNGAKTQYLYINPKPQILDAPSLTCAGVQITAVQVAQFLGLQIHAKKVLQSSIQSLQRRFWLAWQDLTRAYGNFGCNLSMQLLVEPYLACLPPAISYGCKVWASRCIKDNHSWPRYSYGCQVVRLYLRSTNGCLLACASDNA